VDTFLSFPILSIGKDSFEDGTRVDETDGEPSEELRGSLAEYIGGLGVSEVEKEDKN
jgi:hypothetical protein